MKKYSFILLILFVLLGTAACNTSSVSELVVQPGGILYQDKFSSNQSGWGEMVSEAGAAGYSDGTYRIVSNEANVNLWSHPGVDFSTVRVEVSVFPYAGPLENRMGVICRLVDDNNFYFFTISGDGYYAIGKMKDGQAFLLTGGGQMAPTPSIQTGNVPNRVRGDCLGSQLILYVNEELVDTATDADFSRGDVGILAGTFGTGGADVYFDNFFVYKP